MKKALLAVLLLSISSIGAAYAGAIASEEIPRWATWVMAVAVPCSMVSAMALGAARAGRPRIGLGRLVGPFAAVLFIMLAAFAAALVLPAAGEPHLFGLPLRAGIILYGIGLLPALILPLAYALTFDEGLTDDDVERVREAARAREL